MNKSLTISKLEVLLLCIISFLLIVLCLNKNNTNQKKSEIKNIKEQTVIIEKNKKNNIELNGSYAFTNKIVEPILKKNNNLYSTGTVLFIISMFIIFFTCKLIIYEEKKINFYALIASMLYGISSTNFFTNLNLYMHTIVSQTFFCLLVFLIILIYDNRKKGKTNFLYIILFIMLNSIYLLISANALILSILIAIFSLINLKSSKIYLFLNIPAIFITILALLNYAPIINYKELFIGLTHKIYSMELCKYAKITFLKYIKIYMGQLIILALIYIHYINRPRITEKAGKNLINMFSPKEKIFLSINLFTILIYHYIFPAVITELNYIPLIAAPYFALSAAIIFNKIIDFYDWKTPSFFIYSFMLIGVFIYSYSIA